MTRKRLYPLVVLASLVGIAWLAANFFIPRLESLDTHICLFRLVTGIPCPACGSTRSILSLIHGDVIGSLYWNPAGLVLLLSLIVFPLWILYDTMLGRETFLKFYRGFEKFLLQKWVLIPAVALILVNWAWNIFKGLT